MIRQLLFTLHVYWISVCLQWYTINDYILDAAWPTSSEVHRGSSLLHASTSLLFYAEVCTCNTVVLSELRGSSSPRLTNCLSLRLLLNVSSQHICIVLCSRVLLKCPLAFILRRSLLFFPLIYARWSYLTWFYFLPRAPRRPRWVLLLQVHRSRAEHNAGGKILDCKRDTKVHLPAITCTIPRLLPN